MIRKIWDITLTVSDLTRAVDFYQKTLGLEKKYQFKDYAGFDCGGIEIGLKTWGEMQKPRQGEPCVDFAVDNIDETYNLLTGKGVEFEGKPAKSKWGSKVANFHDPDGNSLALVQVIWAEYLAISARG